MKTVWQKRGEAVQQEQVSKAALSIGILGSRTETSSGRTSDNANEAKFSNSAALLLTLSLSLSVFC